MAAAAALAIHIRQRRTARGWSQQKLAEAAAVAYGTVRAIESGAVTEPGVFTVSSIAEALGLGVDDLLSDR